MRTLVLAVAGLALLVTGVVGLALPVHDVSVECGTGFSGVDDAAPELSGVCEDKITLRRVWGWPVGVIGLALVGGAVVSRRRSA